MTGTLVPERLSWAVRQLAVGPDDRVLEIGCGHGVAAALVCEQLTGRGRITATDRSAKMIEVAERRNAACVAAGRAVFRTLSLENAQFPDRSFETVFAVNVNLFWTRTPTAELALIRRILVPGGALYLCYEPPAASWAKELVDRLEPVLTAHGYACTTSTGTTASSAALVCLRAEPAPA